jgi:hypothetical protein
LRRDENDLDFQRVADVYETIAVAKAQTVLRYWNWSLSSAFAAEAIAEDPENPEDAGFARDLRRIDAATRVAFGR